MKISKRSRIYLIFWIDLKMKNLTLDIVGCARQYYHKKFNKSFLISNLFNQINQIRFFLCAMRILNLTIFTIFSAIALCIMCFYPFLLFFSHFILFFCMYKSSCLRTLFHLIKSRIHLFLGQL